jgi:AcrR family transcriptional regulator
MHKTRIPPTLTHQALLDAALAVVDAVGIDALTIRSVATAAKLTPLSLYSYFVRKDQLLDSLAEGLGVTLLDGIGSDDWQTDLAQLCQNIRCMLLASPRRFPLLSRWIAGFPRPALGRLLDALVTDGLSEAAAVHTMIDAGILALTLATRERSALSRSAREDARSSGTWARDEGFQLAVQHYLAGVH